MLTKDLAMKATEKPVDVVVAGHVCLDVIPRFRPASAGSLTEVMVPGKLVNVDEAAISTGGAVSNTGLAMIRLGARTLLMGKVGQDFFGTGVLAKFSEWGSNVASAMTVVPGENTSYSVVLAPPEIDRMFLHNPGANDTFCSRDINYGLVWQARLFHLGYPPLMRALYANEARELVAIYRRVKELDVTTSMDMTLPDPSSESGRLNWRAMLEDVLPLVDIAPFSAEEAMFMLDRQRFDQRKRQAGQGSPLEAYTPDDFLWIGRELLDLGAAIALVKCGERGILLLTAGAERIAAMGAACPKLPERWANRALWEEAFLVEKIVSATGAGDCTIAGFLVALLRGCDPEHSLRTASCVGAQNVKVLDAVSGVHTWEETQAMMRTWPKRRQITGAGWCYCDTLRLWRHESDAAAAHGRDTGRDFRQEGIVSL